MWKSHRHELPRHRFAKGPSRRDFLCVGAASAFGISALKHAQAVLTANTPARACILLWLDGGPSHLETLDPKPQAPREVRGPFAPISTAVSGIQISELMPRTAAAMGKVAIIRSMTSPLGEHNFGTHYLLTGYKPTPALDYPAIGSVIAQLNSRPSAIPAHVAIPNAHVGGGRFALQGFLPQSTAPFELGMDPAKPDFRVRDLDRFPGVTQQRLARRRSYLQSLQQQGGEPQDDAHANAAIEQAYRMVTSKQAREAFDLAQESAQTRTTYGSKSVGQSCLLARRLVEAGVPFVTINQRGWDTHNDMVTRLKDGYAGAKVPVGLVPSMDTAFAALVQDLDDRGLLEQTLVVAMGEFGRTPKLNTLGGRDHWPRVFSVMLAGGGIRGGQVVGQSDAMGESPLDRPVTPADLAATIYQQLGISPTTILHTPDGRPIQVAQHGNPIQELIG